jgi:hypothetical protein
VKILFGHEPVFFFHTLPSLVRVKKDHEEKHTARNLCDKVG